MLILSIFCAALLVGVAALWTRVFPLFFLGLGFGLCGMVQLFGGSLSASGIAGLGLAATCWLFWGIPPLRRLILTNAIFKRAANVLPKISETERAALDAGTVWVEGDLFSGRPDWKRIDDVAYTALTEAEQDFLDGPTEVLCGMLDDWQIHQDREFPDAVWDYLKSERFFGMEIPEAYGGLDFSAAAHSAIVTKIATRSIAAAVTVMVPNSLGPAELLVHYGTDAQKDHYLPRLADGREIPCFALTGPEAGSDAGAMQSIGVVEKRVVDGEDVLGISLTFEKRYITLAPVATLIGLAFKLQDPDGLLGGEEDRGITCALLSRDIDGLSIGHRHDPLGIPFANGPLSGSDVFIPLSAVIGGEAGIGQGWRMLMESLAAGRSISLPSLSVGAAQLATRVTGAYATIREQFDTPIGHFEGVEELLARIAGYTYIMDAARHLTTAGLDAGEKPSVISGIVKCYLTEGMRQTLNDAMDLRAGAAIIRGPQNILSRAYGSIPIGITVEGSNVLTRSMIIFGQGAIRAHPYMLGEVEALQDGDRKAFDRLFWRHVGHVLSNGARSFGTGVVARFGRPSQAAWRRRIDHHSASFAFLADVILAVYGGGLKRREMVSGRMADALAWIYLGTATIKRDATRPSEGSTDLTHWAVGTASVNIQSALRDTIDNLPNALIRSLCRVLVFPMGLRFKPPSDQLDGDIAEQLLTETGLRADLTPDVYVPNEEDPALGRLEAAIARATSVLPLKAKLRKARREGILSRVYCAALLEQAVATGVLSAADAKAVAEYDALVRDVVAVDAFTPQTYRKLR